MRAFYSPDQALHSPRQFMRCGELVAPTDVPARTGALLDALARLGITPEAPADYGREPAGKVHPGHYMDFLESAFRRWQELPVHGPEVLPNTFPDLSAGGDLQLAAAAAANLARDASQLIVVSGALVDTDTGERLSD